MFNRSSISPRAGRGPRPFPKRLKHFHVAGGFRVDLAAASDVGIVDPGWGSGNQARPESAIGPRLGAAHGEQIYLHDHTNPQSRAGLDDGIHRPASKHPLRDPIVRHRNVTGDSSGTCLFDQNPECLPPGEPSEGFNPTTLGFPSYIPSTWRHLRGLSMRRAGREPRFCRFGRRISPELHGRYASSRILWRLRTKSSPHGIDTGAD